MDSAPLNDAASEEGSRETLLGEMGALAANMPFDLAVVSELTGGVLEVRATSGPLAVSVPAGRAVPLEACPAERSAVEAKRPDTHGPVSGEVDPLFGTALPEGASRLAVPLATGDGPIGVLSVVRAAGPFDERAIEEAAVHAKVLALTLATAAMAREIERLQSHGEERVSLLEMELRGTADGVLDASQSPAVRDAAWRAKQVAKAETPVLILGETGVGKEWLAHAIHRMSGRADRPFVKMNCAAIAAGTLDSELFGHEKGAFTGATRRRPGRFQIADGGTLLLDEVGELPLEVQAKLLRVLQDGTFFPVGSDRQVRVDVRILAATHVNLERAIAAHTFRDDLFYRLSVFPLRLPALRDRLEDLPMLCSVLLAQQAARTGRREMRVTPAGIEKLASYAWPGNLRELGNVLERATILSQDGELGPDVIDLPERAGPPSNVVPLPAEAPITLDEAQRRHIGRVLAITRGRIYGEGGAAKILGLKPSTLQSRMQKLGMRKGPGGENGAKERGGGEGGPPPPH